MVGFSYDEEARACYIIVSDKAGAIKETVELTPPDGPLPVNADYLEDGSLYGIEILLPPADSTQSENA